MPHRSYIMVYRFLPPHTISDMNEAIKYLLCTHTISEKEFFWYCDYD